MARGSTGMRVIPDAWQETKAPKQPQLDGQLWAQEDLTNKLTNSTTMTNGLREAGLML